MKNIQVKPKSGNFSEKAFIFKSAKYYKVAMTNLIAFSCGSAFKSPVKMAAPSNMRM